VPKIGSGTGVINAPNEPVAGATSVHTGEPWAGSKPWLIAVLALGLALTAMGQTMRRRSRTNP
jgi:hypothetical protein